MGEDYDALVVSGGAARGPAFLGALHKLGELGKLEGLTVVAGTSIGALAAVLVAQKANMLVALQTISHKPFELDFDLISLDPPFGVDSGVLLLKFIRMLIGRETFKQLRARSGIDVIICATSLLQRRPTYFQADTHPDMEVAWAVRLSCTLPLIFAYGTQHEEAFVDGGLTDNFPVKPVVEKGCRRILGLRFKLPDPTSLPTGLTEYVMALMCCVAWQGPCMDNKCKRVLELVVDAEVTLDFSMKPATLWRLFSVGYTNCV